MGAQQKREPLCSAEPALLVPIRGESIYNIG